MPNANGDFRYRSRFPAAVVYERSLHCFYIGWKKKRNQHKRLKSHLITLESLKPKMCTRRFRYYILFTSPCEQSSVCILKNTAFKIRELIWRGGEKMSLTCCTSVSENYLTSSVSGQCQRQLFDTVARHERCLSEPTVDLKYRRNYSSRWWDVVQKHCCDQQALSSQDIQSSSMLEWSL